jgi:hypothetical protein
MENTLIVQTIQGSDRNIVLLFEEAKLVGLNFWQGCGDMTLIDHFKTSDTVLFQFVKRQFQTLHFIDIDEMYYVYGSDNYLEILEVVDGFIWDYVYIYNQIDELELQIKNLKSLL